MSDDLRFRPIPPRLFLDVEPEAGEVLLAGPRRTRDEFHPNWGYITEPSASPPAVVAALTQAAVDVPDGVWERVLEVHCPDAWQLPAAEGWTWEQFNTGQVPAMSPSLNEFAVLVNTALDGWELLACFRVADVAASIEGTLGSLPEFR